MDNTIGIKNFLQGYKIFGNYDQEKLKWCLINGYCHFYLMNREDKNYQEKILELLSEIYKLS